MAITDWEKIPLYHSKKLWLSPWKPEHFFRLFLHSAKKKFLSFNLVGKKYISCPTLEFKTWSYTCDSLVTKFLLTTRSTHPLSWMFPSGLSHLAEATACGCQQVDVAGRAQPGLAAQGLSSGAICNTCRCTVPVVDPWVSQWKTRKEWLPALVACWHEKCDAETHWPFYWKKDKGQSPLGHRSLTPGVAATENRNIDLLKQVCLSQLRKQY